MKYCTTKTSKMAIGLSVALALTGLGMANTAGVMASKTGPTIIGEKPATMPWTAKIMELINNGNAKKGAAIAKEHNCKKCHGKTGISDENDTPNIAGLTRAYSFKQMFDYKYGRRKDKDMRKRCGKISDQNIADIAAFYADHKSEPMMGIKASKTVPVLAVTGDKSRQLLACDTCHNKNGTGRGLLVPLIAGQKREHFVDTMLAYKEAERDNDDYGVMRFIAEKLTEEEIEQLALYYGSVPLEE